MRREPRVGDRVTPERVGDVGLPTGPSNGRPVTFEVTAYDVPYLLVE